MTYTNTYLTITRGTAVPITIETAELGDLTDGWEITFTMRTSITSEGNPLFQCKNEDAIHMTVSENKVIVHLYETETWNIPANAKIVYVQLTFKKLVEVVASKIYCISILPTLLKTETPR